MKPAERHQWIVDYLKKRNHFTSVGFGVSVVDAYFVDDYVEATDAAHAIQFYGAHKCKQLGRDLTAMFKAGTLQRARTGLGDMHSMGFPAWVWTYKLSQQKT